MMRPPEGVINQEHPSDGDGMEPPEGAIPWSDGERMGPARRAIPGDPDTRRSPSDGPLFTPPGDPGVSLQGFVGLGVSSLPVRVPPSSSTLEPWQDLSR